MFKIFAALLISVSFNSFAQESDLCISLYNSGTKLINDANANMKKANQLAVEANEQTQHSKECEKLGEANTSRHYAIQWMDKGHRALEEASNSCRYSDTINSINSYMKFVENNIMIQVRANEELIEVMKSRGCI